MTKYFSTIQGSAHQEFWLFIGTNGEKKKKDNKELPKRLHEKKIAA